MLFMIHADSYQPIIYYKHYLHFDRSPLPTAKSLTSTCSSTAKAPTWIPAWLLSHSSGYLWAYKRNAAEEGCNSYNPVNMRRDPYKYPMYTVALLQKPIV